LRTCLLLTQIDPTCEALGPGNKLIFAPGLLAGPPSPTSTEWLSVGGKSPLTQGIKEANAGGMAGDKLGHLGLKAIVVEGQPTDDRLYLLHVTPQGAHLLHGGRYDRPYRIPS
jgi:aldehyde:ferredoxin oxidoreductase